MKTYEYRTIRRVFNEELRDRLNRHAKAGFRVINLSITGESLAIILMEREITNAEGVVNTFAPEEEG